jgi:DNA-binding CsgD family transcriptional regulator
LLDERDSNDDTAVGSRSTPARLRAIAAALQGDVESTETWAARAAALIVGQRWDLLESNRAKGLAALAAHDPPGAVRALLPVWRHTVAERIDDPGAFPVGPDLVEAALWTGDMVLAESVTNRLVDLSEDQDHPWGLASVKRCQGLVALADAPDDYKARTVLHDAAAQYEALDCRFDAARTLLAVGRHARRTRKWAEARDALGTAVRTFQELGCDGWAAEGRSVLSGVGGRKPRAAGTLTPTEMRVSELASRGLSNKEIASALFVSEHTVEVHLSHAYPKLGVRSRAELSRALTDALAGRPPENF